MKSPLSYTENCTLLRSVDAFKLSKRWEHELGINWQPPRNITKIEYWRDEETGLQFFVPEQAAGEPGLYSQLQRFPWYYMAEKWEFSAALHFLRPLSYGSRVLEVGVGQGAFLAKAKKAGLEVIGIELNPEGAKAARDMGFDIIEQDMSSLHDQDSGAWDCICAFQVLEHLAHPREFLDQAVALLKPGGLLVLSVPNAAVARKLDPECNDLLDQPPHHMSHWDEEVFRSLENLLPLKLKDVSFEPLAPYHVDWFVGSWAKTFEASAGVNARRLVFNRLSLPLVKSLLAIGARKLIKGHTLLVSLMKQ
jgi:2-polyprenyl-3-methyl-5-hydroxy-6-metoxy-1,4-benzoquinol methylase